MASWRDRTTGWLARHPFVGVVIGLVVFGWLAYWESQRIAAARRTVLSAGLPGSPRVWRWLCCSPR